ncbi:MAG TPA: hypothetical protein VF158_06175 [Longimicrobiales bacterium]
MRSVLSALLLTVALIPDLAARQTLADALRPTPTADALRLRFDAPTRTWGGVDRLRSMPDLEDLRPDLPDERGRVASRGVNAVLYAVGGAMIGAWIGYFASQVIVSDWEGGAGIDRVAWAAGGAVVGSLSGVVVASVPGATFLPPRGVRTDARNLITTAEIRQSGKQTVYQVIAALRPEWLIVRGIHSIKETPQRIQPADATAVITDPGTPTIKVYLNGARLGGVEALKQVSAAEATVLEFVPPAEATQRFGAGHSHGAIVVYTI